jgi:MFS family permease
MNRDRLHYLLLNLGHLLDHLLTLVFATVAALALVREWGLSYGELLAYATPGFFAFGLFSLPAGWLADRWSRDGMMVVFFIGIGLSSIATGFAQTPLQIGLGLFVTGVFAAIYHPVGLAIVTAKWRNTGMRIAVNGVWGNFGVASAALITGYFIDHGGWRSAFIVPGIVTVGIGILYAVAFRAEIAAQSGTLAAARAGAAASVPMAPDLKALLLRVSIIVFATTAISSIIFQSTTFALPKIFDERLRGIAATVAQAFGAPAGGDLATTVGLFAFLTFTIASLAQVIVGSQLDRFGARPVFLTVAAMQLVFFGLMPGLHDAIALAVALGFMLGAFGQIPINDYMIGRMASGPLRARIYGVRYVVSFTVLAAALPLIAFVHERWGFDMLFRILALSAAATLVIVAFLPRTLPVPAAVRT